MYRSGDLSADSRACGGGGGVPLIVGGAAAAATNQQKPTSVFGLCALFGGRIVGVPIGKIARTSASVAYMTHTSDVIPPVCVAHLGRAGGCASGAACAALHVDAAYMERIKACEDQCCCAFCGEPFSRELLRTAPMLQLQGPYVIDGHAFPIERLAITACIQRHRSGEALEPAKLCRDHIAGGCPRSKDCGLFHPCRERLRSIALMRSGATAGGAAAVLGASQRSSQSE